MGDTHTLELSLTGKCWQGSVKTLADIVRVHLASMF